MILTTKWSWQKPKPATSWAITNKHCQRVGDIYNPGHGRSLQIRNNDRQIIGYIERDGTVTNTHRQPVAARTARYDPERSLTDNSLYA